MPEVHFRIVSLNNFSLHGTYLFSKTVCKSLLAFLSPATSRISDAHLADTMIGKAVEHMFETEDGSKDEWRGMVLARAPIMNTWFYITYEKDPVLYMYQLLDDYKEGDLRIMPDSSKYRLTTFTKNLNFRTRYLINSHADTF